MDGFLALSYSVCSHWPALVLASGFLGIISYTIDRVLSCRAALDRESYSVCGYTLCAP